MNYAYACKSTYIYPKGVFREILKQLEVLQIAVKHPWDLIAIA
jgi:hypothetical protein